MIALLAQTMTALPVGAPTWVDKVTVAITALALAIVGLAEAVRRLIALKASVANILNGSAIKGLVRGVEAATAAIRCDECEGKSEPCAACARLQRKTKGAIKAVTEEEGVEDAVHVVVEETVHKLKPHTRGEIKAPDENMLG